MNQLEKNTYNKYLATTRSLQNKPFSLRKNFDDFESHKDYPYVIRLQSFFNRFPQIDPQLYFEAPFKVYPDEQYFDLKFYTSQKAIKAYSMYMKQLQDQDPDSEPQLNFIRDSIRFIAKFCFQEKIQIKDYISYCPKAVHSWMKHLKNHNISIYTIYGFPHATNIIANMPEDEIQLLMGNTIGDFWKYKIRYYNSKLAKDLIEKGFEKATKILSKETNGH